jgi:3-hydroxyisobutyrate dehydrogenase
VLEPVSPKPTVAVLGAGGAMGVAIARNIARAGFPVRAWNRSREKALPLVRDGAQVLSSPAEAAEGAAIVVTMLSDAEAVLEVMDGEHGFLSAAEDALVWVQMSTIGVAGSERCAEAAQLHGVTLVDAPVLGSREPAQKGELIVLASGPEELQDTLEPLFAAVASRTMWVGPAGSGSALKVVANSWIVTVVEGAAETIALAEGTGVDPLDFLAAVAGGPLDLPYMRTKVQAMLKREFEPSFRLELAAKDACLAAEVAEQHDLDLPLIATVCGRLTEAVALHGDEDMAATYLTSAPRAAVANGSGPL